MTEKMKPFAWVGHWGELCAEQPNVDANPLYTADQVKELTERLGKVKRERDKAQDKCDQLDIELGDSMDRATTAEAALAEARKVIEPFLEIRSVWVDPHNDEVCRAARSWLSSNKGDE